MRRGGAALLAATAVIGIGACGRDAGPSGSEGAGGTPEVGFLSASASPLFVEELKDGLDELGYSEDRNLRLDLRTTDDETQLPAIAQELVAAEVDLIIAGGTKAVEAAMAATSSIPIVMTNSGDPVGTGLVESMDRPGGNVTGLTQNSPALAPKRLELVEEAFPGTRRVAVLVNPEHPSTKLSVDELREAAPDLDLELMMLEVSEAGDIRPALMRAKREGVGAVIVLRDPFTVNAAGLIARVASRARLPGMYETSNFLEEGGLMLYGPDLGVLYRRSARYVDKVLQGADPGELPIEGPTQFELVINTRALDRLGIDIPEQVRQRAEEM